MMRFFALATLLLSATSAFADQTRTVNCSTGQSITSTLATLTKLQPATVTVQGTCTEYVLIDGFENLTLAGAPGATLQQPSTPPPPSPSFVLSIKASRIVTVSGLTVRSLPSVLSSIGIGGGSNQIRLQDVATDGAGGIFMYERSQVWLVRATVNITSGFAGIWAFACDVHIVDGLIERPANSNFNAGLFVSSGQVTVQGMTIRDMQLGIDIVSSGNVGTGNFDPTAASIDVIIDNPSGTNFNGAVLTGGSSLNLDGSSALRINNAGQPYGSDTGAVFVSNGSTLTAATNASPNLVITNSRGQGVIVSNNSHARLAGSTITGGAHGGLVVTNLSTASVDFNFPGNPVTTITGNGTDVFCDSQSRITGGSNIANANTVSCNNLLPGSYENLP